ncbi:MAG: hypothetical protein K0V04_43335 [Deltaproteobacteria bacterium]|nr:hypothetical protein [Deltaproteobacteria bacterium]
MATPVGLGAGHAAAAPSPSVAPGPAPAAAAAGQATVDPSLVQARDLYEEGRARFDTFDYEGAVELWTRAYSKLPTDADGVRNRMVYNIATAQQLAFDIDHDVRHLRQAVLLLQQYVKTYRALHQPGPAYDEEIARADARIAALQARIDGPTNPQPAPGPDADPAADPVAADARYGSGEIDGIVWTVDDGGPTDPDALRRNRQLSNADRKTDRMLIGSYVALSVGGALTLAGTGATLGTRQSGQAAQGGSVGTLALGLAGLATGFTLLGIGLQRRKRARQGTLVAATPVVTHNFAGVAARVRF